jgi:hypothetical protein
VRFIYSRRQYPKSHSVCRSKWVTNNFWLTIIRANHQVSPLQKKWTKQENSGDSKITCTAIKLRWHSVQWRQQFANLQCDWYSGYFEFTLCLDMLLRHWVLDIRTLKIRQIRYLETSGEDYLVTQRHVTESCNAKNHSAVKTKTLQIGVSHWNCTNFQTYLIIFYWC